MIEARSSVAGPDAEYTDRSQEDRGTLPIASLREHIQTDRMFASPLRSDIA